MSRTVLLDIRANQRTGIARFGAGLVRALGAARRGDDDPRFIVLADPAQPTRDWTRNLDVIVAPAADGFVRRSEWVRDLVAALRPDLYVTTHYTVDRRLAAPFMHTIHDLGRLLFPQYAYTAESVASHYGAGEWELMLRELHGLRHWDDGDGPAFVRYFRALNRYQVERARAVATVSHATRARVLDLLRAPPGRVHVVPGGVDPGVFRPQPPGRVRDVVRRYRVSGPFCLYVGLVGPTKRFLWSLDVLLRHRVLDARAGRRLVVVGGQAERRADVRRLLVRRRARAAVVFCGYVPDRDLACLYTAARALVVPSLSEGFHLPTAEALACGAEVIAADIPALRETAGRHAHLFPAADEAALASRCDEAMAGRLPARAGGFVPPRWSTSANALRTAVTLALDG